MKLQAAIVMAILLVAFAGPALGNHVYEPSNYDRCQGRIFGSNPGFVLSGESCVVSPVYFGAGNHITLTVRPFEGYDTRNTTISVYAFESGHTQGWNRSAEPLLTCTEGYEDTIYVDECSSQYRYLNQSTTNGVIEHEKTYVFVQTPRLNFTEIAPTIGAITIPTGLATSWGQYGFELEYNVHCPSHPDYASCRPN